MDENMYRQRIKSLEEHTDKLVERNDQLRKELEWVGDLNRALVDGHEKAVREVVRICYALGDGEDYPKNADDAVDWVVALKAELAGVIEGHKAQIDMLAQVDFEKDRQIANLKRIVAERGLKVTELEKWKDSLLAQMAELQAKVTRWDEVGTGILFFLNGKPGMDGYAMANFVDSLPKQVIEAMGRDPYEGTTFIRLSDV